MNWRWRLLGRNRTVSSAVVTVAVLVAIGIRLLALALEPARLFPEPYSDVPLVSFLSVVIPLLAAVGYAYWNDGWLVTVGIVYCAILARPPGAMPIAYPDPAILRIVTELWWMLPLSVVWGTACYLVGVVLQYIVFRVRRPSRASG